MDETNKGMDIVRKKQSPRIELQASCYRSEGDLKPGGAEYKWSISSKQA